MRAWLATALVIAMSAAASADPQQQRTEYRWPDWVPWSIVGAGALSMTAGVFALTEARESQAEFDRQLVAECPEGCSPSQLSSVDTSLETRARLENRVALGLFVAGPAVIITGAVIDRKSVV